MTARMTELQTQLANELAACREDPTFRCTDQAVGAIVGPMIEQLEPMALAELARNKAWLLTHSVDGRARPGLSERRDWSKPINLIRWNLYDHLVRFGTMEL